MHAQDIKELIAKSRYYNLSPDHPPMGIYPIREFLHSNNLDLDFLFFQTFTNLGGGSR